MELGVLFAFVSPIVVLGLVTMVYRIFYPRSLIEEYLRVLGEYKALERRGRGKRAAKRLRAMESSYKRARRSLLKANLFKFMLVILSYLFTSMFVFINIQASQAPAAIPFITAEGQEGELLVNPLAIHFLGYIYAIMALRDALL